MKNYMYITPTGDGWRNLAIDEYLLDTLGEGDICLLLYVNSNAVIVGRNQNPWIECDLEKMSRDGVQLVRRCSGGGAVFHDRGNLNYSFIAHGDRYDEERQIELILRVLRRLGVQAERSGRNDITVAGRKISGTAFCHRGGNRQHHGTLLIDADMTKLSDYLTVAPQKLEAKGVKSVRSRVCNLSEICPEAGVDRLKELLTEEFAHEYGGCDALEPDAAFAAGVDAIFRRNRSQDWLLGMAPAFDYTLEDRFDFGMARLCLNVREGRICEVKLYTDALDFMLPEKVEKALLGRAFNPGELPGRLVEITRE